MWKTMKLENGRRRMHRPRRRFVLIVIVAALAGATVTHIPDLFDEHAAVTHRGDPTAELEGAVTRVRDGDTIEVEGTAVRLSGLHAPEMDQPGGQEAKAFMVSLVAGKRVRCVLEGRRNYDREIGDCFLNDRDISAEVIAAGLGRDCLRYSGGRYAHLETVAGKRLPLPGYCPR
ncbi:thermonuclease family protein [Algihabitans albus]|uniref:thermonuclease family protein n=1 Tax=Algihabitans albus TaxID=2164067 RepID=UPI001ABCB281|nr:thermonuclease family protein [Algihabitans albus]